MHSLFNRTDVALILDRIGSLTPQSVRQWGKMTVSQMLAHCSLALEVACGKKPNPRPWLSYLFGPLIKKRILDEHRGWPKNSPTDKDFVILHEPDFATEKNRLTALVSQFFEGGRDKCTQYPHSFFGAMAPEEWAMFMYKHLDHHLRQFGV
ncbi:DUF1569 domain-containing protein [Dinghuibacter silviterrae]|uniref:Uncharacterized protein DUF1569 n=1 Tax=Dinghuibacter silviterrae TaxID=1539049 RepID=A0A4R8DGY3_9BACT|nr:DUF1569 domain-containing protein [Dinghuibacter silviterrae]TDW96785.1 uncharacterized protein DUF1569 [Dinghuibacter silviterrae]